MMNNSFITNSSSPNEDKAIECLLTAFVDSIDKKSKEQYRQVRNVLEKKIDFNTYAEKNFLTLLVKLIASGRIADCKKLNDLVRHSVYVYEWPKRQKSYSTYCNKFIDYLDELFNSTSKDSTKIKSDITSKCTTPTLTSTEAGWLKEAFKGNKVYSHEQLIKKFTARLRSQDRISGDKVWLPLRYISKLYKKNGKAKEYSDWLNKMAEEIFVHYEDDKKEIKSVQFKAQQMYLVFKANSQCKGTYDVYVALSRDNKEYEAYTPTGVGNTKVPMTVTDISDIAIDHVKPIDQTLRDLDNAGKIENLKKVSDAYKELVKKSQVSYSNAVNASLAGLNVNINALTNELDLIRKDGVLRLMHSKYNGKKSNSSTYDKIIEIKNKNTYYGLLGKVIIDGSNQERDLYYNLKERNAKMRVALKALNGTEVKITKAIIDYI